MGRCRGGGATVYEGGGDAWVASSKNAQGSSSITFTSVNVASTNGNQTIYSVHGNAPAMLIPKGAVMGNVTMDITF